MAKKTEAQFIEECNLLVQERGIALVPGQQFRGFSYTYKWQCVHDGVTWEAVIKTAQTGRGCPKCGERKPLGSNNTPIAEFITKLLERNGKHDPVSYLSGYNGLSMRCTFICDTCEHEWDNKPNAILTGIGCPECHKRSGKSGYTYNLDDVKHLIEQRNIRLPNKRVHLVDSSFVTYGKKAQFTCDYGHTWSTKSDYVLNADAGCPHCANRTKN